MSPGEMSPRNNNYSSGEDIQAKDVAEKLLISEGALVLKPEEVQSL